MLAAVVHAFGQPPRLEEFSDPTPGDGEVIVQVRAAGLHPVVKALASGAHYGSADQLPQVAGGDGVGVIAARRNRQALDSCPHKCCAAQG